MDECLVKTRRSIARSLRPLLLTRRKDEPALAPGWCLLGTMVILVAAAGAIGEGFGVPPNFGLWGLHSATSFEIAIHRVRFGKTSHVDPRVIEFHHAIATSPEGIGFVELFPRLGGTINALLREDPNIGSVRALDLPGRVSTSDDEYARELAPYKHNENFAVWFIESILRLAPNATVTQVFQALKLFRFACIGVFCFFLLRAGASAVCALAATTIALAAQRQVDVLASTFAYYSFLLPLLLCTIGFIGLHVLGAKRAGFARRVLGGAALGLWLALVFNARTSYLPILATLAVLGLFFVAKELLQAGQTAWQAAGQIAAMAIAIFGGFVALDRTMVGPVRQLDCDINAAHHLVAHNVVLALGIPENDLALREGIVWNDFQGVKLARKVDPDTRYLGPTYEQAMLLYYAKLWLYYPGEMLDIYKRKFLLSGKSAVEAVDQQLAASGAAERAMRLVHRPMRWLPSGLAVAFLNGCFLLLMVRRGRRVLPSALAFAGAALAGTALLLQLESAMVMPTFVIYYHSFLMFWSIFFAAIVCQAGLDGVVAGLRFLGGRRANRPSAVWGSDREGNHEDFAARRASSKIAS